LSLVIAGTIHVKQPTYSQNVSSDWLVGFKEVNEFLMSFVTPLAPIKSVELLLIS